MRPSDDQIDSATGGQIRGGLALDTSTHLRFGRPELVARIRQLIAEQGPITFERFMDLALYEPGLGYYASLAGAPATTSGPLTDFQTSPQVHPLFGRLLARELLEIWGALGQPNPFVIAELGAGFGELAVHVLGGLAERVPALRVEYHAVDVRIPGFDRASGLNAAAGEQSRNALTPTLSQREREKTLKAQARPDGGRHPLPWGEGGGEGVLVPWRSLDALSRSGTKVHCVVSNEFFDALPTHRLAFVGGRLREIYVDWSAAGFVDRLGELSDPSLASWVAPGGAIPTEGWRGEVCSRLERILSLVAGLLDSGVVLTVDYGYRAGVGDDADAPGDTLVAYHRHHWTDDVYRRIGEQDLTCHVDFGAFLRVGRQLGLEPAGATTQRDFLLGLDFATAAECWSARERSPALQWQSRFAAAELVRFDGLGRLNVMAQQKGLPSYRLTRQ